jgi:hypothetical protein
MLTRAQLLLFKAVLLEQSRVRPCWVAGEDVSYAPSRHRSCVLPSRLAGVSTGSPRPALSRLEEESDRQCPKEFLAEKRAKEVDKDLPTKPTLPADG